MEQVAAPIYKTFTNPRTTILGAPGQVELHLTAEGPSVEAVASALEALAAACARRSRAHLQRGRLRAARGGGGAAAGARAHPGPRRIVHGRPARRAADSVPGASAFLERGYVTYSNASKVELLGVDPALLDRRAPSPRRSARGHGGRGARAPRGPTSAWPSPASRARTAARRKSRSAWSSSPPRGAAGDRVRRVHFPGGRDRVRFQASQAALEMMRRGLLGLGPL